MTSRLVVNNIDNDTGVTTIRLNPTYTSFELNSAERLRIDSSGRLLLGTTTEGAANGDDLTIATSGVTGITIRSGDTSTGNIFFSDATTGTGEFAGAVEYSHGDDSLRLHSNANERLRISSSGYVGINTNSPQRPLHVVGTGRPVEIGSDNAVNIVKLYASTTGRSTYNGLDITVNTTDGSSFSSYGGYLELKTSATNGSDATSRLKITSSGNANINKNLGIQTSSVEGSELVGAGTSFFGAYIGDGMLAFHNRLDNPAGYYVAAHVNGLNAGPVTLGSTMTLAGTWTIV